jgi:hypothetical protein
MAGKSFKIQMKPTFNATVKIPRVGGEPLVVPFTFKTLDRRALAKVFDKWKSENIALFEEAKNAADNGNEFSLEEWADREIELQIAQVKDIVDGWGFDDDFNDENIEALVTTSVSVTDAILEQYNEAYTRARSGN